MLDVRLSRRSYALIFAVLAALAIGITVTHRTNLPLVEAAMFLGYLAASLVQGAVGGWMGSLVPREADGSLGAWFSVANTGAGGIMMLVAGQAVSRWQPLTAAIVLGAMLLAPTLIYLVVPAPGPDRKLARESYSAFFAAIFALLKRRPVRIALMLFLLPSASFALTNVLGGIGPDFGADERMVALLAGVGSAAAGVGGSLLLPVLARRLALRPCYLAIGIAGGVFTLSLLALPHAPWVFAVAITGENLFQALAFAASNAITFETIGPGNPLAATLFSLLLATSNLAITYMGFVDARAYTWHGATGAFLVDALVSIAVCATLWTLGVARSPQGALPAVLLTAQVQEIPLVDKGNA